MRRWVAVTTWAVVGTGMGTIQAAAQSPARMESTVAAPRAALAARTPADVHVDGRADDPVWRTAPVIGDFRQFDPVPDAAPTLRTEFQVAFDEDDLYVLVRAHDPSPDSIMRALSRRDVRGPSDQIGIYVDAFLDRRTGYGFWVNPDGVKRDVAIYDDTREDTSWNGVWDVATLVDEHGWTAEFRIPLSQLRFAEGSEHEFGFGVRRSVERYPEQMAWPSYSRATKGLMSQLGTLRGLSGLGGADRLELTPYVVAKSVTRAGSDGFSHPGHADVGADVRFAITPNATLNATVNPDFGQVEADPGVLNLSAFETFLAERRPFFVEGTGLYRFALNCYIVVDCQTNEGLFYSRRIGRRPSLTGLYGDASTPTSTPIVAAAKLTGRSSGGLSYGVLDAVTRSVDGTGGRVVEPGANHAVVRVQQDLDGGDAGFGAIVTAVNRELDGLTSPWMHESAYVAGVDARRRFGNRNFEAVGSLVLSRVAGAPEAITRTQTGPVHYYQQPVEGMAVDSSATSLSGWAMQLKVGKYGGGVTRFESSLVRQSRGFDVNDLGYLQRADVLNWSTWSALSFQEPTGLYRWAQVNLNTWHAWTTGGARTQSALNLNGHMGLHNSWNLHLGGTLDGLGGTVCDRCTRGGPLLRKDIGFFPWGGVNGDSRKPVAPGLWVNLGFWDGGRSSRVSLSPSVEVRPSTRLTAIFGANVSNAHDHTQWFGNFGDGATTEYTFAHLDQRTLSMALRLNYTLTPNLTFELYGEPFTSSGTYSDLRRVSATPQADAYDDRFETFSPPEDATTSFSYRQLRTNAVVRWEWAPGSTLFLVWAHGRTGYDSGSERRPWQDDLRDLFDRHPDNTFLVKAAYWFNR